MPGEGQGWAPDELCGVFVPAELGNDENGGTPDAPVKMLARAIALAPEHQRCVYACAETFEEALIVTEGVIIHGGLDCAARWQWDGVKRTSMTTPQDAATGTVPLTMRAIGETVRLEDVDIVAPSIDPSSFEASSIATIAARCQVKLTRCTLTAGDAAPGVHGESPMPAKAMDGGQGRNGKPACSAKVVQKVVQTDALPVNECGAPDDTSDDSRGGQGDEGDSRVGGSAGDGSPGEQTNRNGGAYTVESDGFGGHVQRRQGGHRRQRRQRRCRGTRNRRDQQHWLYRYLRERWHPWEDRPGR